MKQRKPIQKSKIRKRKMKLSVVSLILLTISAGLYFCASLFLRSYNNALSTKTQKITTQIAVLQTQNDAVAVDIQTLTNRDRVDAIAQSDGLTNNASSVITISADTDSVND